MTVGLPPFRRRHQHCLSNSSGIKKDDLLQASIVIPSSPLWPVSHF
jgi:hypothetical protein